jgi:hypothetical protein
MTTNNPKTERDSLLTKGIIDYVISYNAHSDVLTELLGNKKMMNLNQYELFEKMHAFYKERLAEYEEQKDEYTQQWLELRTQHLQQASDQSSKRTPQKS